MPIKRWKRFNEEQNDAPGSVPEFGAIFISSGSTRKECLRRRIFGLPFGQAAFVKQIRTGMVLFLFEYESRELHGVFLARSDGGMNIIPHAYSSTGKKYPSQVEFSRMWHCRPLCEDEFRGAIKENYFTQNKFKFGLSEVQVKRLLTLFSMKKVDDRDYEGPSNDAGNTANDNRLQASSSLEHNGTTGGDVDFLNTSMYPFARTRAYVNDGRSINVRAIENEPKSDWISKSPTRNEYSRHKSSNSERECDTSRLGTINCPRNDFGIDANYRMDGSVVSADYSLNNSRRVSEDPRQTMSNRLEKGYYEKDDTVQVTSSDYPSSWSNYNIAVDHNKQAKETDPPDLGSSRQYARLCDPRDTETCVLSYREYQGDTIITSTTPYDPHSPQIDFNGLSTVGANHSLVSLNDRVLSLGNYIMEASSSEPGQPFPQRIEQRGASNLLKTEFDWGDSVPLSNNPCEYSTRTNRNLGSCEIEGQRDMPFLSSFSDPWASMETGNSERSYDIPSHSYRNEYEMPEHETVKGLAFVYPDFTRNQFQDHESYPKCETQKTRSSVFSRLALPPKKSKEAEKNSSCVDSSVDEVMVMLHQRCDVWTKQRNVKPTSKDSDAFVKPKMKKPSGFMPELLKDEISVDVTRAYEEDEIQAEEIPPLINFKRRSETRTPHDDSQNQGSRDNSKSPVSPAPQQKRRRLIRPRFIDNEPPPKDKGLDENNVHNVEIPSFGAVCKNDADKKPNVSDTSSVADRAKSCLKLVSSEAVVQDGNEEGNKETTTQTVQNGSEDANEETATQTVGDVDGNVETATQTVQNGSEDSNEETATQTVQNSSEDGNAETATVNHKKPQHPADC